MIKTIITICITALFLLPQNSIAAGKTGLYKMSEVNEQSKGNFCYKLNDKLQQEYKRSNLCVLKDAIASEKQISVSKMKHESLYLGVRVNLDEKAGRNLAVYTDDNLHKKSVFLLDDEVITIVNVVIPIKGGWFNIIGITPDKYFKLQSKFRE